MCLLFPAVTLVFFNLQYCNIDFEAQCVKSEALTWPVSFGVCVCVCVCFVSRGRWYRPAQTTHYICGTSVRGVQPSCTLLNSTERGEQHSPINVTCYHNFARWFFSPFFWFVTLLFEQCWCEREPLRDVTPANESRVYPTVCEMWGQFINSSAHGAVCR